MITKQKYIILESLDFTKKLDTELCIFNFNIMNCKDSINSVIKAHPNTTFWAVTENFSKEYVEAASKLGIQNILQLPIKTETIENFFKKKQVNQTKNNFFRYEPLENTKILIVDDNKMNIDLLCEILSDLKAELHTFTNPTDALNLIKTEKFNLFLLDILMPQMSGFELAKKIKETPFNSDTPVIFISAVSGEENIINGYKLGACSYIEKPFSPSIIKAQIYNILKAEATQTDREKESENFVAMLTHDLKSPINAEILALKHILKNTDNNNSDILGEILNSAKYMKLITDKILCFYRHRNCTPQILKTEINFSRLVISCLENIRYLAVDKNIEFRLENNLTDYNIKIDELEIARVINNLIANAVEYSVPNSHIDIKLFNDNNFLYFVIRDYGVGIDLKKHKEIFDEYVTLSKEQKKTGFGLGLNICKSIINTHKGNIEIKSEPNKGTKIKFSLPYKN